MRGAHVQVFSRIGQVFRAISQVFSFISQVNLLGEVQVQVFSRIGQVFGAIIQISTHSPRSTNENIHFRTFDGHIKMPPPSFATENNVFLE